MKVLVFLLHACGLLPPPDLETAAMLAADALEQRAAEQQQEPAQQSPASLDAATSLRLAAQLREQVGAQPAARDSGLGGCSPGLEVRSYGHMLPG